jgi:hypothetical protein
MQAGIAQGLQGMGIGPTASEGGRPTVRNPLMTFLLPVGIIIFGNILGPILVSVTEMGVFALVGSAISLVGAVLWIIAIVKMTGELKTVTNNPAFAWWPALVPIYQLYWAVIMLPAEMTRAKQMRGVQTPTRGLVVYLFLLLYAYAADLNDIAKAP